MRQDLSLFPLHTVLFPGRPLPLHIFEARYRLMISRCLANDEPFGVVLIRAGREVGDPATPYSVGTAAEIVRHEQLADGRMHLICLGRHRFRIADLRHDEPYLTGVVVVIDEDPPTPGLPELATALSDEVAGFVRAAGAGALELPTDPIALSFAVAALLPLDLGERQELLETTSTAERLGVLRERLARERRLRRRVGDTRPAAPGMLGDLSRN
jgi:hypothetical protein